MTYLVELLEAAKTDYRRIYNDIAERSPQAPSVGTKPLSSHCNGYREILLKAASPPKAGD